MTTPSRSLARPLSGLTLGLFLAVGARAQLTSIGSQFWNQDSTGVEGAAEEGDLLGRALAVGDFNCDGFADLAIGAPNEDVQFDCNGDGTADPNECEDAGSVNVIYGSALGLHASQAEPDQILTQATSGVTGDPESGDHFGAALAVVNFRDTACDDLAVGVPDEDITFGPITHDDAGMVNYFSGSTSGLDADGSFQQGVDGVPENSEDDDHFGAALAQGPLVAGDCAGLSETLAIGVPGEDLVFGNGNGIVVLVVGSLCSPGSSGDLPELFDCGTGPCQATNPDLADRMGESGAALAASRVDDASPESFLAIGAPTWKFSGGSTPPATGGVGILRPDDDGILSVDNTTYCQQGVDGAAGAAESGDRIGGALAIGDFDGDGRGDLAVGASMEDVDGNSIVDAGGVSIFYGGLHSGDAFPTGGGPPAAPFFDQNETHFDSASASDHFGAALATGDFDADGEDDLAIGVPDENLGADANAGMIHVLYGSTAGLSTTGDQAFDVDDPEIPGATLPNDFFGLALAAGDFDGDGRDDLAVGAPQSSSTGGIGGGVFVLYGGLPGGFLDRIDVANSSSHIGEGGSYPLQIERTGNLTQPLFVTVAHFGGTATAGTDYIDFGGTLSWNAGQGGIKTMNIGILSDTIDEPNETIDIGLDAGGNHCLEPPNFTVTIDDDEPNVAGTFRVSVASQTVPEDEGNAIVTITRTGGTLGGIEVSYATADGSALHDLDYDDRFGSTAFSLNELSRTVSVPIFDDPWKEPIEAFTLTLTQVSAGTIGSPSAQTVQIFVDGGDANGLFGDGFEHGDFVAWSAAVP
jgi:hypothetical protein